MIHINALLALAAALLWGGGDFCGGMGVGAASSESISPSGVTERKAKATADRQARATADRKERATAERRAGATADSAAGGKLGAALRVVMLSNVSSFAVLVGIVLLRHEPMPHGRLLAWALLGGCSGGVAITCFYLALSRGAMGASAAVSGLLAAAIPAAVSIGVEGAPSTLRFVGFLLAAVAIWMIAAGPARQHAARSTVMLAVVAGIGFGVYFVALRMANPLGIFMPMVAARVGSLGVCGLAFLVLASRGATTAPGAESMNGRAMLWALGAGALDTSGNLFFIAATRMGRLDVAAVLASLYPASTIVLAGWLLHERLSRRQWLGMAVAVGAVAMISL